MDVLLATCRNLPEVDADSPPLLAALAERGVAAGVAAWDDPDVRWGAALTVLRSTWDYHHRVGEFLSWIDGVAAASRLLNPAPVVRWNANKRYLSDLAARGAAVVPTTFVPRGPRADLAGILASLRLDDAVVKPVVSAGSFQTRRLRGGATEAEQAWFAALVAEREMMIQPYVASVEDHGERSLVFVEGEATHAVRKSPRFAAEHEAVSEALPIATDELELAHRILATVRADLLYARVDLARDAAGNPMVMELELIEPSLFLDRCPAALERLAAAIAHRARAGRR